MVESFSDCGFFHVCTDGNQLPWLFKDTEDFIQGVNRSAICTYLTGIQLYSFILMDNHVHFVCYGTKPACKDFINKYKNLSGKYISLKYGIKGYLKGLKGQIIPVTNQKSLMEIICYIDRNSIVAGYDSLPMEYPWGSSRYLFKGDMLGGTNARSGAESVICRGSVDILKNDSRCLGDLTVRERWKCLGSRMNFPQSWTLDDKGMILPQNFLELSKVEALFRTPVRYLYFLSKKLEGKVDDLLNNSTSTFIPYKFLRPIVSRIAQDMYGAKDIDILGVNARMAIARKLKYEYAATVKQISRMLYLNAEILKGFI